MEVVEVHEHDRQHAQPAGGVQVRQPRSLRRPGSARRVGRCGVLGASRCGRSRWVRGDGYSRIAVGDAAGGDPPTGCGRRQTRGSSCVATRGGQEGACRVRVGPTPPVAEREGPQPGGDVSCAGVECQISSGPLSAASDETVPRGSGTGDEQPSTAAELDDPVVPAGAPGGCPARGQSDDFRRTAGVWQDGLLAWPLHGPYRRGSAAARAAAHATGGPMTPQQHLIRR